MEAALLPDERTDLVSTNRLANSFSYDPIPMVQDKCT